MEKPEILVIAGPTASGKTAVAVEAAKRFDAEIISCDSMQLYRFMDIGSAKPSQEELAAVPHHLIGVIDPKEPFSAAVYQKLAKQAIADVLGRGRLPIVCGGTGLYLNAILYEMDFGPSRRDEAYREELAAFAQSHGEQALFDRLVKADPAAAERIHPHNVKRVIRALEAAELDRRPLAAFENVKKQCDSYTFRMIGLTWDRPVLYSRIDERVDKMLAAGLEEEVRGLLVKGFTSADISMKGIGYKELLDCFAGLYPREEAVRLIKRNTRHLAKRQMTWFRRYPEMTWFNGSDYPDTNSWMEAILQWADKKY